MENILELLKNEKVEWKKLGEIGDFYGGLTGKNKKDFENGNKKFITYKNVYSNLAVDLEQNEKVKIGFNESNLPFYLEDDKFFTIVMPIVLEK